MTNLLPKYHEFYDQFSDAPWAARPAPGGKKYMIMGEGSLGCLAVGNTLIDGLSEFDAKAIANAPEALSLILRMARHLSALPDDTKAQSLVEEVTEMFASIMKKD